MILALLVSGDVVVRVSSVPAELVLLVTRHVHVLEVAVRLLSVPAITLLRLELLREGVGGAQTHGQRQDQLEQVS